MPPLNALLRHWNREQRVLLLNLSILKTEIKPEAIHDFRVSIKKLRSYLKLYAIVCKEPAWKNDFTETERLFSILGKHRDIQMNISNLETLEKDNLREYPLFKVQLHANLKLSSLRIKPAIREYDAEELKNLSLKVKPDLMKLTDENISTQIEELTNAHIRKVNQQSKKIDSEAHNTRKLLKDIFYWTGLYPVGYFYTSATKKKLDKILNGLGKWQDQEVLLIKIKHYRQDFVAKKTEEHNDLKQLETYIKETNQAALDKNKLKIQEFTVELQDYQRHIKATREFPGQGDYNQDLQ